jgi:uncharacterized membrane protein YoaK (UPF0700 family)
MVKDLVAVAVATEEAQKTGQMVQHSQAVAAVMAVTGLHG